MSVYQLLTIVVLFFYFSLSSLLWLMNVPGWLTICCDTYRCRFYQNMVMKPLSKTGYIELDFSNILLKLCEMLSFEWSNFFFFFNAIFAAFFFFFFFLFCQYIVCAWCKWLKNDCYPPPLPNSHFKEIFLFKSEIDYLQENITGLVFAAGCFHHATWCELKATTRFVISFDTRPLHNLTPAQLSSKIPFPSF